MERKVVLVLADEVVVRRLVTAVLADAGFVVTHARNGGESIDLIVTDRADAIDPAVKTLYLTADRDHHNNRRAAELHMPFRAEDIREAAAALVFARCRCPSCLRRCRGTAVE